MGTTTIEAPTPPAKPLMAAANVVVRLLLRSPLHCWLSDTVLLLTYTGRKSGRRYTNPVSYSRAGDLVTMFTSRSWWRNLRGGAPARVEIKRRQFDGTADAISDDQPAIAASLLANLWEHPSLAKGYNVPLHAGAGPILRRCVMPRVSSCWCEFN